jgi:RNA-directed DNA polymerase
MKPGNAGGGKGPWFEANARRGEGRETGVSLQAPIKVQKLQAALHAKAKESPGYRFYTLYDKVYREELLAHAWRCCRANGGAAGADGERFEDIEALGVERWLGELAEALRKKEYRMQPVRRVYIPKPDGKERPLGIPTIRDRVVQTAVMLVLEPIFEADLQPEQYAYRPGRSAHDAVRHVHRLLNTGHTEVVDADLSGYFDSIPHAELMQSVARRVSDRHLLHLIKMWLVAPVEEDDGRGGKRRTTRNKDTRRGIPQGAPISPLLANLYMRRFVLGWKVLGHERRLDAHIVNFADDFVMCCRGTAGQAMAAMRFMMKRMKLTVNEDKTHCCCVPMDRFDFLGYTFGRCYSPRTGRSYIGAYPSKRSRLRVVQSVSEWTRPRWLLLDAEVVVGKINRLLNGWANYFCLGPVDKSYRAVDAHTRNRLRRWLRKKHKLPGKGYSRYPDGYLYDVLGLVRLPERTRNFPWVKA